jgi:hypothetical protein
VFSRIRRQQPCATPSPSDSDACLSTNRYPFGFGQVLEQEPGVDAQPASSKHKFEASWLMQFGLLAQRSARNIIREPLTSLVRAVQSVLMAVVTGLIFLRLGYTTTDVQNRTGVLFFMMMFFSFNSMTSVLSLCMFLSGNLTHSLCLRVLILVSFQSHWRNGLLCVSERPARIICQRIFWARTCQSFLWTWPSLSCMR